jgi:hypothetical protein
MSNCAERMRTPPAASPDVEADGIVGREQAVAGKGWQLITRGHHESAGHVGDRSASLFG